MFLTKLEKNILKYRIKTIFMIAFLAFCYLFPFLGIHWLVGLLCLLTLPINVWVWFDDNLYFPSNHYFKLFLRQKTKEERIVLNNKIENSNYLKLGEIVFLENFLVFTRFGVVLQYKNIQDMSFKKVLSRRSKFYYAVQFECNDGKKYQMKLWDNEKPFVGPDSDYLKVIDWIFGGNKNEYSSEQK